MRIALNIKYEYNLNIDAYEMGDNWMHKEVVMKKKAPSLALILLIITLMIYLYEAVSYLKLVDVRIIKILNGIIIFLTLCLILFEIIRCEISYKYSIIANKLIINKLFLEKEKNVESINIKSIVYIGKKSEISKKYNTKFTGNYFFKLLSNKCYCCIYEKDNQFYKFNFMPSEELLRRLNSRVS